MFPSRRIGLFCICLLGIASICSLAPVIGADQPGWQTTVVAPPNVTTPPSAYSDQADYAAASATDAASKPRAASKSFKQTLSAAAAQAHKDGTITRWDLARIRLAIAFRPQAMAEAQACCVDQAQNDGLMRSSNDQDLDGFDWTRLVAFMQQLLPMILQIISILG